MKLYLAENIRNHRKALGLTQERLAEALCVTVGAVSKWELGQSVPDILLIMEMADLFGTSVDVLLGYDLADRNVESLVERLRTLRNGKEFDEGIREAERTLQKFPNHFGVVYQSATLYHLRALEYREPRSFRRAITLFEQSLNLIGQNTNETVNEWTIHNRIATCHIALGQTQKGLELMKRNNPDGWNDSFIGDILANSDHDPEEALPYLSKALMRSVLSDLRTVLAFVSAYKKQGSYSRAEDVLHWMLSVIRGLKLENTVSYLDKAEVELLISLTMLHAEMCDRERALETLRAAKLLAERFDAEPDYSMQRTKFHHGDAALFAFDDFGATATDAIKRAIVGNEANIAFLWELWEELGE